MTADGNASELEQLLSISETADLLGLSEASVFRLMRQRQLRPVRIGRRTLFEPATVRMLIASRRVGDRGGGP